ncbi:MAG: hypothetical protein ACI9WR_000427, partial [Paracoccaceae bacterium]
YGSELQQRLFDSIAVLGGGINFDLLPWHYFTELYASLNCLS